MPDTIADSLTGTAGKWLAEFEAAINSSDPASVENLFHGDSHWRDLVALTWRIQTISGADGIAASLTPSADAVKPSGFEIDPNRAPPRRVTRAEREVLEAIIRFETTQGRASGVLRLIDDDHDKPRAWTLLTALEEIKGFEESVGKERPSGKSYSRDFKGPNWLDQRQSTVAFEDRDPAVLISGGGQAGLSIAARLTHLGIDTLVVDRGKRIGDNWRNRYHALTLHNQVHVNHLPYMPFPPNWPAYIPKDKVAGWFEAYSESLELNVWSETEFTGGSYDDQKGEWSVGLRRADGTTREMHPRHVIMATGVSGIPNLPDIPSLKEFGGKVIHSSEYSDASDWAEAKVIIVGTGNSAHDIAQDLTSHGAAAVTMVQRSPTTIVDVEPSAQLPYALYDEGPSLEDCDLIAASAVYQLMKKTHQMFTQQTKEIDKELHAGLARIGFKMDFGEDDTGWQFKYLERGGGYYFNVGCSDMLIDGRVGLIQFDDIDAFIAEGVRMNSSETLKADLIVLATGFKGQNYLNRKLFGDGIADRVGGVWGFDREAQELRNMWTRTPQPGLWFHAGSFAQCRIYSKYLALQIKAVEEGLIG